ncbi:hypothetical protein FUA19_06450 [Bacillus subtilis]|uniref:hypothetical protein n=1 Tax=Bacillus spizizenii TaxID=96241 RepID=UPI0011CB80CF|nr:hypothetical protein FUA19_06450 [Bacillus subtilis]
MKFIYENIQWIFSGIGLSLIGFIGNLIFKKKRNEEVRFLQRSGDNSINIQGENIHINTERKGGKVDEI